MSAIIPQLITADDMLGEVIFTQNINNDNIKGFIMKAIRKDLQPRIHATFFANIQVVYNLAAWSGTTAYVIGDKVTYSNRAWRSIQAGTNKNPVSQTAYWTEVELYSVWRDYLKPYLIYRSAALAMTWGGVNITRAGARYFKETTSDNIPLEERVKYAAMLNADADLCFIGFNKYMKDNSYIVDGFDYTPNYSTVTPFKPKINIDLI